MRSLKYLLLTALLAAHCFAEAPKVNVVQSTSVTCTFITALPDCRIAVVVIVESKDLNDTFLVGIRYRNKDGKEIIESRYPTAGGEVWFFQQEDVIMLSATAGSLKTNEVGLWIQPQIKP